MKLMTLVLVLMLLVGLACGEISCQQSLNRYQVAVGDTVTVTVNIANPDPSGDKLEVTSVSPVVSSGLSLMSSGGSIWAGSIGPGKSKTVSYSVRAERSGNPEISTMINYIDQNGAGQVMPYDVLTVT